MSDVLQADEHVDKYVGGKLVGSAVTAVSMRLVRIDMEERRRSACVSIACSHVLLVLVVVGGFAGASFGVAKLEFLRKLEILRSSFASLGFASFIFESVAAADCACMRSEASLCVFGSLGFLVLFDQAFKPSKSWARCSCQSP